MKSQTKKKMFFDDSEMNYGICGHKKVTSADSPEVLYVHYADRLAGLHIKLSKLTLLDHPCEIQSVCARIILLRQKISILSEKYKTLSLQSGHVIL